ncbi:hypothetical protein XENOCAPTIV_025867 [Xenoophorus captivus]|uniref:Vomeronasal type-1 receptor n=1 Tax=Xenoophorus captivus TaxID=1517983 RepID=A0ABV0QXL3_9TELE
MNDLGKQEGAPQSTLFRCNVYITLLLCWCFRVLDLWFSYSLGTKLIPMSSVHSVRVPLFYFIRDWTSLSYHLSRYPLVNFSPCVAKIHRIINRKGTVHSSEVMLSFLSILLPANSLLDVRFDEIQSGADVSMQEQFCWRLTCCAVWRNTVLQQKQMKVCPQCCMSSGLAFSCPLKWSPYEASSLFSFVIVACDVMCGIRNTSNHSEYESTTIMNMLSRKGPAKSICSLFQDSPGNSQGCSGTCCGIFCSN